ADAACCATGSSFVTTTNSVVIGGNTVPEMFQGSMDEIRVWTRALCQGEIQNNMNGELTLPQTGLLAYYQFDEGVASGNNSAITTLTDVTGNGYDGTLNNFALTGTTSNWTNPGGVTNGVNAPAFVAPVVTVNSPTICAGTAATLTASGVVTYTWSSSATTATITATPTVTTNYTVTGADANNCLAYATSTVNVNPSPIISSQSGSVYVCGDTVNKSFTVNSAGTNTYQWYWNSGTGS